MDIAIHKQDEDADKQARKAREAKEAREIPEELRKINETASNIVDAIKMVTAKKQECEALSLLVQQICSNLNTNSKIKKSNIVAISLDINECLELFTTLQQAVSADKISEIESRLICLTAQFTLCLQTLLDIPNPHQPAAVSTDANVGGFFIAGQYPAAPLAIMFSPRYAGLPLPAAAYPTLPMEARRTDIGSAAVPSAASKGYPALPMEARRNHDMGDSKDPAAKGVGHVKKGP